MEEKDDKPTIEYYSDVKNSVPQDGEEQSVTDLTDNGEQTIADLTDSEEHTSAAPQGGEQVSEQPQDAVSQGGQEKAAPPKRKRVTRILGNILLVAAIALGILSLFGIVKEINPDSNASFIKGLSGASLPFCLCLVAVVIAAMALDVSKFCIISKAVTGKFRVRVSVKTNFLGRYYDAVTPFSTGGQPMQIYYLNTKGISGGNSSAMVFIRYIFSIMCWIILGCALMIWGSVKGILAGVSGGNLLKITGWIGIGVNLIVPTFVILFIALPKFMHKLTLGVIKLGYKMKIVKNIDRASARALKIVDDFKNAFKLMATSPVKFIALLIVCFSESALTFAIPYFVMKAFSCPVDGMLISVMSLNVFATFGVSFIPTPGNSGVMEGMGALAFSAAAGDALILSVLTWRLSVFYIYILIGLIITVCDVIIKNVKNRKTVKKAE